MSPFAAMWFVGTVARGQTALQRTTTGARAGKVRALRGTTVGELDAQHSEPRGGGDAQCRSVVLLRTVIDDNAQFRVGG